MSIFTIIQERKVGRADFDTETGIFSYVSGDQTVFEDFMAAFRFEATDFAGHLAGPLDVKPVRKLEALLSWPPDSNFSIAFEDPPDTPPRQLPPDGSLD
jgi:hypothetical protein